MHNSTVQTLITKVKENDPSTTEINFEEQPLSQSETIELFEALKQNTFVTKLEFRGHPINKEAAGLIAHALLTNETLTEIYLGDTQLGNNVILIAAGLIQNRTLKVLDINSNEISDTGADFLAAALSENSSLRELELSCNNIGAVGFEALRSAITKNPNSALTTFGALMNNNDGAPVVKLIEELCANSRMRRIALIKANKSEITEVDFSGNNNNSQEAKKLFKALKPKHNSQVQKLNFFDNPIDKRAAKVLAKVLTTNTTLKEVNLGLNNLGDEGAGIIAEALTKNNTLQVLKLPANKIHDESAPAIANSLQQNSTLTKFDLTNNRLTELGLQTILNGVIENQSSKLIEFGVLGNKPHFSASDQSIIKSSPIVKSIEEVCETNKIRMGKG